MKGHISRKQTEQMIMKAVLKHFNKWMIGQTCPIVNGDIGHYEHDVKRYLYELLKGLPDAD